MSLPNTVIIPHGATEARLAEWLRSELRTQAIIYQPYGRVERAVSMKEIGNILSSKPFDSVRSMHARFGELDYSARTGFRDVMVVPVLAVDLDRRSFGSYRSGDTFSGFCLGRDAVLPVFNDPDIEAVIDRAGYGKVAHDLGEFQEFLDSTDIEEFLERMRACDSTNMDALIERLRRFVPSCQR